MSGTSRLATCRRLPTSSHRSRVGSNSTSKAIRDRGFWTWCSSVKPDQCTLVPVKPGEITSEAGWPADTPAEALAGIVGALKAAGVRVSLFVDPEPAAIRWAKTMGADRVELYTEPFARAFERGPDAAVASFAKYTAASNLAYELGVGVNAGHDLDLKNLTLFKTLPHLDEVSIGHALISRAIFVGLGRVVKEYIAALSVALLSILLMSPFGRSGGHARHLSLVGWRHDRRRDLRSRVASGAGGAARAHAVAQPWRLGRPARSDSRGRHHGARHRSAGPRAVIRIRAGPAGDDPGCARGGAVAGDAAKRAWRSDRDCRRVARRQPGAARRSRVARGARPGSDLAVARLSRPSHRRRARQAAGRARDLAGGQRSGSAGARTLRDIAAEPSGPREQHVSSVLGHGTVLLDKDGDLARMLVDWLRRSLLS